MSSCTSCGARLNDSDMALGVCPICKASVTSLEDQQIQASIALPKNWDADGDLLSELLGQVEGEDDAARKDAASSPAPQQTETDGAATASVEAKPKEVAEAIPPKDAGPADDARAPIETTPEEDITQETHEPSQAPEVKGDSTSGVESKEDTADAQLQDQLAAGPQGTVEDEAADGEASEELQPAADTQSAAKSEADAVPDVPDDTETQPDAAIAETSHPDASAEPEPEPEAMEVDHEEDAETVLTSMAATPETADVLRQSLQMVGNERPGTSLTFQEPEKPTSRNALGDLTAEVERIAEDADPSDSVATTTTLTVKSRTFSTDVTIDSEGMDYTVIEQLGVGGMGVVNRAKQNSIDRSVAIKTLKSEIKRDKESQFKFLAEAVVTGDLEHPNIVPIYDLGTDDDDNLFYSMKHVVGTCWMDAIKDKSLNENLEILMRVADAVAYSHSRGVIHRDLKPENVMLGGFGEVLVMDWGLALTKEEFNDSHHVNQSEGMGGTPAYMAPEMIIGEVEEIGPASDIYLLGAILFEVITGGPPHTGRSARECLVAAARNVIRPTEVKGELMDIAMQALSTKTEERQATVLEFQEQIHDYYSHTESAELASQSETELTEAEKSGDYQVYARALFGFQKAFELWSGNAPARAGMSKARVKYANHALKQHDYDLAASLLDENNPVHGGLLEDIHKAQSERDARQRRLKIMKLTAAGMAAVIFCIIGGAFFWIRAEAENARLAEGKANESAEDAKAQKELADEAAVTAKAAEEQAKTEAKNAEVARKEAETDRMAAVDAKAAAEDEKKKAEEAREQAEKNEQIATAATYVALIGLAAAKIDENSFVQAVQLLNQCSGELRNWEWGRLMYLARQYEENWKLNAPGSAVVVSADGNKLVAGCWDGRARVLDAHTPGKVLHQLPHKGRYVNAVDLSKDGRWIATGSTDKSGYVQLWDAETGKRIRVFEGHTDGALSVRFSKSGKQLLTGGYDKTARLWDVESGKELQVFRGHNWWVWDAEFSPDEAKIVTASQDGTAIVWSVETGLAVVPFTGHQGPVYSAAFLNDGKVVSAGLDNRVLLWDPKEAKPYDYAKLAAGEDVEPAKYREFLGHRAPVRSVCLSADGKLLASSSQDNTVRIWDVATRKSIKSFRGHSQSVNQCVFGPSGKLVYSISQDKDLKRWNIHDYEELRVLEGRKLEGHTGGILSAEFSPDGDQVVTASRDRSAVVWETQTGNRLQSLTEGHLFLTSRARFSDDGKQLVTAAADGTTRVWTVGTGTERLMLAGTGRTAALDVSGDGRWIVTGSDDNSAKLWDVESSGDLEDAATKVLEPIRRFVGHTVPVTAAAFSRDGKLIYTGDASGKCRLWNRADGSLVHELDHHTRRVVGVGFSADGSRMLSASGDNTVAHCDVKTGQEIPDRALKHPDSITSMAVSADGKVVTSCSDGIVRLWNSNTAEIIHELGKIDTVNSVAFSADGQRILAANNKRAAVLAWETTSGKPVDSEGGSDPNIPFLQCDDGTQVWAAQFTPDGQRLLTVGGSGSQLWTIADRKPALSFSPHTSVSSASFSTGGKLVVTGSWDNSAKVWDAITGKAKYKLEGGHNEPVNSAKFSRDASQVLTASNDGTAALWQLPDAKMIKQFGKQKHRGQVFYAEFSPDETRVLTACSDKVARLFDTKTGQLIREFKGHLWSIRQARFSSDGKRIITGSDDTTARIWNADDPNDETPIVLSGHTATVTSVAFAPDGQRVLTASRDNSAKVWDALTGKEILTLNGHTREVTSISFSPKGKQVLTGSRDGTAILWLTMDWKNANQAVAGRK